MLVSGLFMQGVRVRVRVLKHIHQTNYFTKILSYIMKMLII